MDCKTATQVYSTDNPLKKIQELFPEAWQFLEDRAIAFAAEKADRFDSAIKKIVGETPFHFRITHQDDRDKLTHDLAELLGDITSRLLLEKHFSEQVGMPLFFSTICCSSHLTVDRELTLEEVLPIQKAAVELQTNF
jgi:hypothetical protein